MNDRQIDLVRHTFARAERASAHVAATFYAELFALEPSLRRLFKPDIIAQGQKLMHMLGYVVERLDEPAQLLQTVRALAIRHLDYGVEARHYGFVGLALMRTLRHEMGPDFNAETRAAWGAAYQMLSETMIRAAYGPQVGPAR